MSDANPTSTPPTSPAPPPALEQPPLTPTMPASPPLQPVPPVHLDEKRGSIVVGGILFLIGAGFYLPVLLMARDRQNLAGLLIPGTILFGLGTIFFYNIFTDNWGAWAYIWTLIPASVGLGLLFAARVGHWGGDTMKIG